MSSQEPVIKTVLFELVKDEIVTTTILSHQDNQLFTQESKSVIPYEALGVKSKTIAKSVLTFMDKKFANINGVTHYFEYQESQAIEVLKIEFQLVSERDLANVPGEGWLSKTKELVDYPTLETTLLENGYQIKN